MTIYNSANNDPQIMDNLESSENNITTVDQEYQKLVENRNRLEIEKKQSAVKYIAVQLLYIDIISEKMEKIIGDNKSFKPDFEGTISIEKKVVNKMVIDGKTISLLNNKYPEFKIYYSCSCKKYYYFNVIRKKNESECTIL